MVDREGVREKILGEARNIFSQFGFRKTTMEEIAQAARKGKSSIYYYFTSKEDIFKAVVEKEAKMLQEAISRATADIEDPVEKLKKHILVRMETFKDLANFYAAIKSEYLNHLEFIEKIRIKYDQDEMNRVEKILQEGVRNGEFRIDDTRLASVAIVTAMKGMEIPLFWEENNTNTGRRLDEILNILFYGIIKR